MKRAVLVVLFITAGLANAQPASSHAAIDSVFVTRLNDTTRYLVKPVEDGPLLSYLIPQDGTVHLIFAEKLSAFPEYTVVGDPRQFKTKWDVANDSSHFSFPAKGQEDYTLRWLVGQDTGTAGFMISPKVDSAEIAGATLNLFTNLDIKIEGVKYVPSDVRAIPKTRNDFDWAIISRNGTAGADSGQYKFTTKGFFWLQPDSLNLVLLYTDRKPFLRYMSGPIPMIEPIAVDTLPFKETKLDSPATPTIRFMTKGASISKIPFTNQPIEVTYNLNSPAAARYFNQYLRSLSFQEIPIMNKTGTEIGTLSLKDPQILDTLVLNITGAQADYTPAKAPYTISFVFGPKGQSTMKCNVGVLIVGIPNLISLPHDSYYPGDTISAMVSSQDLQNAPSYSLINNKDSHMMLSFRSTSGGGVYSCIIDPNTPAGTYQLYWHRNGESETFTDDSKANFVITVREFREIVNVKKYASFNYSGSDDPNKPQEIDSLSFKKKMILKFLPDSIGLNKGPQFLILTVYVTTPEGLASKVSETKFVTYNYNEGRGAEGGAYDQYIDSYLSTSVDTTWCTKSLSVWDQHANLTGWSLVEVQVTPDWGEYRHPPDPSNQIDRYYLISGLPVKGSLQIGVPQYYGYKPLYPGSDTINFQYLPLSAILEIQPVCHGKPFFIGLGLGFLAFNATKSSGDSVTSGAGVEPSLFLDAVQLGRFFNWFDLGPTMHLSATAGILVPLGIKTTYNSMAITTRYSRWLFGVTAGVTP